MQKFLAKLSHSIKDGLVDRLPHPAFRSDLEYENLLWALLAEVVQGKSWGQLQGFLIANQLDEKLLAQWLQSYGARWLAQPEPNQELAQRLVLLGQVATGELGTVARTLGERLLVPPPSEVNLGNSLAAGSADSGEFIVDLLQLFDFSDQFSDQSGEYVLNDVLNDVAFDKFKAYNYEDWYGQSNVLLGLGRIEEALAIYDQALQLQPEKQILWGFRGDVLFKLGRLKEALASYEQVLQLYPDNQTAWVNRGNVLFKLGRLKEALASYEQVLQLYPDNQTAWVSRGNALFKLGRLEEALASYEQVLQLYPDFPEEWVNRGIVLLTQGRIEEAIASYDQALHLQPDYHEAWLNRGLAAAKSLRYEPFWQKQFVACFRSEVSKAPQQLIPALQTIDRERRLAQFQASLSASRALLLETMAHLNAPNLIALIQQPLSPKLSQLIRQSSPQKLIEFIQQPLSEAVVAKLQQDSLTHPSRKNPQLNQRGYEGQLASYQAELDKAICRDTHPEGWGFLHHKIGRAHYFRGRQEAHPSPFWRKAEMSYKTALQTLKPPEFEELHLKVLQDLIQVLLDLGETEEAHELQRQGADLLRRMLADPNRTEHQKREITLNLSVFNQWTVDVALHSGDISGALTLAETGKNTCLRWLLGTGEIPTLDYAQFQRLLTPTTAAIYWHLSPSALTTFVILPNAPAPIVVGSAGVNPESPIGNLESNDQRRASLQQILDWEKWLSEWNQRYQAYGSSKPKKDTTPSKQGDKKQHPWRTGMEKSLERLKQILNISGIEQHLQNHSIDTLILIPHRDLHRFPLHAFFDHYTCTYLPSADMGLQQQAKPQSKALNSLLIVENPQSTPSVQGKAKTLPNLPFAEVEAALIRQMFSEVTLLENPNTTRNKLLKVLPTPHIEFRLNAVDSHSSGSKGSRGDKLIFLIGTKPHHVFHFTGHGAYNSSNPAQSCLFLHGTDQLTLCDIVRLDLSSYSLVCLAACETAVTGDQTITDEYVGLVSAFLEAGVTNVVSTLWTVESAPTTLFVVEFYQQLHAGQPPKAALKAAQTWLKTATRDQLIEWLDAVMPKLSQQRSLQLVLADLRERLERMDNTFPPYHHPYYWAAFTISGL